jgi:hypothetical protein
LASSGVMPANAQLLARDGHDALDVSLTIKVQT